MSDALSEGQLNDLDSRVVILRIEHSRRVAAARSAGAAARAEITRIMLRDGNAVYRTRSVVGGGRALMPQAQTDLNAIRDQFLRDQQMLSRSPAHLTPSLYVDREGGIVMRDQIGAQPDRTLSVVTSETFYAPDLNKIAAMIRENQKANNPDPSSPNQQLFVDKDGDILLGNQINPEDAGRVSRVTQETFYAPSSHLQEERAVVQAKLPDNTYYLSDDEISGWVYRITNEFNDQYVLFLWHDEIDDTYKVSLVEPRLGGTVGVEDCHIYNDGILCLKRQGGPGYRRLEDAYARSVVWTRGASCYRRGLGFQFNLGQEG